MKMMSTEALVLAVAVSLLLLAGCEPMGPKLVVDQATYNFGQAEQNGQVSHTFVLRNEGDQPLIIKKVKKSCGCTVAKMSKSEIEAGGQADLSVVFNTGSYRGQQKKRLTLETNDPNNARVQLFIEGTVIERLAFEPRALRIMDLQPGQNSTGEVTVTNKSNEDIEITKLTFAGEQIVSVALAGGAELPLPYKLGVGENITLVVTVTQPEGQLRLRGTISIFTAAQPDRPTILHVVTQKQGAVFSPKKLKLKKMKDKKKKAKKAKKIKKLKKKKKKKQQEQG